MVVLKKTGEHSMPPGSESFSMFWQLEDELKRHLDVPIPILLGADKILRKDVQFASEDERVRVVEQVVEFRAELQLDSLGDLEILVNAQVRIPRARPAEEIPPDHVRWIGTYFREAGDRVGIASDQAGQREVGECARRARVLRRIVGSLSGQGAGLEHARADRNPVSAVVDGERRAG